MLLGVAAVFYRIVQSETPTEDDFRTMQELGFPLENEAYYHEWSEGISVYNARDYAMKRARATNVAQGSYVVPTCVPDGSEVEYRQTFSNRRHYTIYANGARALALVCGAAIAAREQEHD